MKKLWLKWTIYCAAGELLGIACAGGIAYLVNAFIGEPQSTKTKLLVLLIMLIAGLIEGTILSWFQWKVLVRKFSTLPQKIWMFYTILVAALGWFLGMLPSLFFAAGSSEIGEPDASWNFSNPFIFAVLSIGSGLILGAIFGLFQWFALRKYAQKAYLWIIANALGWGLGLGWIYLFASIPTEQSAIYFNIGMGVIGGLLAGLSVGAITGVFLVRLEAIKMK